MTEQRFKELMEPEGKSYLTDLEIDEGWHFCNEFDGLLVRNTLTPEHCGQTCVDAECGSSSNAILQRLDELETRMKSVEIGLLRLQKVDL